MADTKTRQDAIDLLKALIMTDDVDEADAEEAATKIIDWKLAGNGPGDLPPDQG